MCAIYNYFNIFTVYVKDDCQEMFILYIVYASMTPVVHSDALLVIEACSNMLKREAVLDL